MGIQFIGMIQHRLQSETTPASGPVFDKDYIAQFAQVHEEAGFDRILVGYWSNAPDGFLVTAHAAASTKNIGFLLAHRPGFVAPTLAARKLATLDQLTGGRLAVHIISGASDADQRKDGDYLDKAARYARTDEYLDILKKAWRESAPFDYRGQHYQVEQAYADIRATRPQGVPVYFGGSSAEALQVGGKHADVFAFWGETLAQTRETIAAVKAEAARHGRSVEFSVSFRPILAATEEEAWGRAEEIRTRVRTELARTGVTPDAAPPNTGSQRLLSAVAQGDRLDKRLWTGVAALVGARNNSTALVGTPAQVADALLDYYDLGVRTFLIRGFDPLEDARDYGRELIPLTQALVKERERARQAA
jgi:alkanesulfonate monooxygenase